ncbi:MAG: hypothetical protein AB1523_04865 [Bacillota bacterium]
MNLSALLSNPAAWQAALDGEERFFAQIKEGKIGLVGKQTCATPPGEMLVWEVVLGKARAVPARFRGWQAAGVELLLVLEDNFASELQEALAGKSIFAAFKKMIRLGRINLFLLGTRDDLLALGFEDFLEALGVPFLGTCH